MTRRESARSSSSTSSTAATSCRWSMLVDGERHPDLVPVVGAAVRRTRRCARPRGAARGDAHAAPRSGSRGPASPRAARQPRGRPGDPQRVHRPRADRWAAGRGRAGDRGGTGRPGFGTFFGGGVDAFYTVLERERELTHLVFLQGFDVPNPQSPRARDRHCHARTPSPPRWASSSSRSRPTCGTCANGSGRGTRSGDRRWRRWRCSCRTSSTGSSSLRTDSYATLDPVGLSTRCSIRLWSTEALAVDSDGCEATRVEKVAARRRIGTGAPPPARLQPSQDPVELRPVREVPAHDGRPPARGALDRCATLPDAVDLRALAKLEMAYDPAVVYTRENIAAARAAGDWPLMLALTWSLRRRPVRRLRHRLGRLRERALGAMSVAAGTGLILLTRSRELGRKLARRWPVLTRTVHTEPRTQRGGAMPERDGYIPGVPCWVDTGQPDPVAAVDFYRGLFGWEFEDVMPPTRPATTSRLASAVATSPAVCSLPEGPAADRLVEHVRLGRQRRRRPRPRSAPPVARSWREPFDVMDAGRMGASPIPRARCSACGSRTSTRARRSSTSTAASNFNGLNTRDVPGARRSTARCSGGGRSTCARGHDVDDAGLRRPPREGDAGVARDDRGGWAARPASRTSWPASSRSPPDASPTHLLHWSVTFGVDDVDAIVAKAVELGGTGRWHCCSTCRGRVLGRARRPGVGAFIAASSRGRGTRTSPP